MQILPAAAWPEWWKFGFDKSCKVSKIEMEKNIVIHIAPFHIDFQLNRYFFESSCQSRFLSFCHRFNPILFWGGARPALMACKVCRRPRRKPNAFLGHFHMSLILVIFHRKRIERSSGWCSSQTACGGCEENGFFSETLAVITPLSRCAFHVKKGQEGREIETLRVATCGH